MSRRCQFCACGEGVFTCPRCHKDYCSLPCYQSASHSRCSEQFYQECVKAELVGDNLSDESREKMQKILTRINAEQNGDGLSEDDSVDSDDDDDVPELTERLKGVDLDNCDRVWELLTESERREFNELVDKGDIGGLLPNFDPWWNCHVTPAPKIQELNTDPGSALSRDQTAGAEWRQACPKVWADIPALPAGKSASPLVKYGVLNLVYSYAYAVRFLYGDYDGDCLEFVDIVERLSGGGNGSLTAGVNYSLADTAVEAAASSVNQHNHLAISLEFSRSVKKDVYKIIKGPNSEDKSYFLLSGLSDLRQQYLLALAALKQKRGRTDSSINPNRPHKPSRLAEKAPDLDAKTLRIHLKKIEYYLSWTLNSFSEFDEL